MSISSRLFIQYKSITFISFFGLLILDLMTMASIETENDAKFVRTIRIISIWLLLLVFGKKVHAPTLQFSQIRVAKKNFVQQMIWSI